MSDHLRKHTAIFDFAIICVAVYPVHWVDTLEKVVYPHSTYMRVLW